MTNSLSFPNMIDPVRNRVATKTDNASVVNRTRLLMLTEPTELYNEPTFGVGLKQYLWRYNNENTKAMIKDKIVEQLNLFEPCVDAGATVFTDGLLFTGTPNDKQSFNKLEMSVGLKTTYGDEAKINLADLQETIDKYNEAD